MTGRLVVVANLAKVLLLIAGICAARGGSVGGSAIPHLSISLRAAADRRHYLVVRRPRASAWSGLASSPQRSRRARAAPERLARRVGS